MSGCSNGWGESGPCLFPMNNQFEKVGDFYFPQDPRAAMHKLTMDPEKPESAEWTKRYHAHLASNKWQELRGKIWDRESGICEGCRSEPIEHVHHLTYAHMGDEFLFELMGLCFGCHLRVHGVQKFKQGFK